MEENFSVSETFQKMVKKDSLIELINKDNQLVAEIRQLDGDMKTLVYENYNSFITATETLGKMKNNTNNMDAEMTQLRERMSRITARSTQMNGELKEKRQQIKQLSGVHNLLKKLQFIFELPKRLNECVGQALYPQAILYHARTIDLLSHYKHLSVFSGIEEECRAIMDQVEQVVKGRLEDESATLEEITECIGMLIGLGRDPKEALWRKYLTFGSARLRKVKENMVLQLPGIGSEQKPGSDKSQVYLDKLTFVNDTLLKQTSLFMERFHEYFLGKKVSDKSSEQITSQFQSSLDSAERAQAKEDLVATTNSIIGEYFEIIEQLLVLPHHLTEIDPHVYVDVLSKFEQDIVNSETLCNNGNVDARAKSILQVWIKKLVRGIFANVERDLIAKFASPPADDHLSSHTNLQELISDNREWLSDKLLGQCLPIFTAILSSEAAFVKRPGGSEQFIDIIGKGLRDFWEFSFQGLRYHQYPSQIRLALARFSSDCGAYSVSNIFEAYLQRIYCKDSDSSEWNYAQASYLEDASLLLSDYRGVVNLCMDYSQLFLKEYVESVATELSTKVNAAIEDSDWLNHPTNSTTVTSAWEVIFSQLADIEGSIVLLYPDISDEASFTDSRISSESSRRAPSVASSHRPASVISMQRNTAADLSNQASPSLSSASSLKVGLGSSPPNDFPENPQLFNYIDKLFMERIEVFGKVEPTKAGILTGVLKIVLKAAAETARLSTFGKGGYQQIQLDAEFLKSKVVRMLPNSSILKTLIEELTTSAYARCVDPAPIDRSMRFSGLPSIEDTATP
ncbi:hypothetical protein K493DRAFT_317256 [Basidiobolus meristosporus CBS 931.73]|uniref:Vacuolar protein sorting-associated protein 51 homolog n=1 Tax=Basidiobolus meristosporus CBS 931.73 TaxID=1314790 RepID=A0A1Y1Y173_9FUNG|nr:hypothetical protein K493DRAFT_317256 [Basidiobolus meristosporus CBS 931.73]|eukprot:ORX91466.1 hypothetical protein K493DRAFT_317256 [Basidiobolus meristosporus CBS 931.73]